MCLSFLHWCRTLNSIKVKKIFLILIFERDRQGQSVSGGGADRKVDTESEAGSRL